MILAQETACNQVAAFAGLWIEITRVEQALARSKFSGHDVPFATKRDVSASNVPLGALGSALAQVCGHGKRHEGCNSFFFGSPISTIIPYTHRKEEHIMRQRQIALSTIGLIAGTRAALGVGLGLLLANRFTPEQRRAAGWALVAIGAITTIPLVAEVLGSAQPTASDSDLEVHRTPLGPYVSTSG
jgi:hypothetical protein